MGEEEICRVEGTVEWTSETAPSLSHPWQGSVLWAQLCPFQVLEKTLESPLDCKGIQPVHPKGNQPWIFIGRTDAKAETPILWPPDAKNWLIGKDPDAGKDWRREEKGMTEDEMVGWNHRLNGHEFEKTQGIGDWQVSLACYSPWDHKQLGTTEQLTWTELYSLLKCKNWKIEISHVLHSHF